MTRNSTEVCLNAPFGARCFLTEYITEDKAAMDMS